MAVLAEASTSSDDGGSYAGHLEDLDMRAATFTFTEADADVTTFTRLAGHGLRVVGQCLEPGRAVLVCRGRAGSVVSALRCRRGGPRDGGA